MQQPDHPVLHAILVLHLTNFPLVQPASFTYLLVFSFRTDNGAEGKPVPQELLSDPHRLANHVAMMYPLYTGLGAYAGPFVGGNLPWRPSKTTPGEILLPRTVQEAVAQVQLEKGMRQVLEGTALPRIHVFHKDTQVGDKHLSQYTGMQDVSANLRPSLDEYFHRWCAPAQPVRYHWTSSKQVSGPWQFLDAVLSMHAGCDAHALLGVSCFASFDRVMLCQCSLSELPPGWPLKAPKSELEQMLEDSWSYNIRMAAERPLQIVRESWPAKKEEQQPLLDRMQLLMCFAIVTAHKEWKDGGLPVEVFLRYMPHACGKPVRCFLVAA